MMLCGGSTMMKRAEDVLKGQAGEGEEGVYT